MTTLQQAFSLATNEAQQYWLRRAISPDAKFRLFCFPYAGGSSRIYRNWQDWLAPNVEVVSVELPGRGIHIRGRLIDNVEVLARLESEGNPVVAVRQGPLLGTAFHPEVTGDTRFHDYFLGIVHESQRSLVSGSARLT